MGESYCFNMKSTLDDEKLKDKISDSDKETITKKCDEIIKWLDANQLAEVDEFTNKQEEHPEECLVVCQEVCQVVCPVVCQEEQEVPQVPVVQEDQPSKKLIKYQIDCTTLFICQMEYSNSHSTNYLIAC